MVNEDEMRVDAGSTIDQAAAERSGNDSNLRKENIKRTFLSGKGRIAIIAVGLTLVGMLVIGFMNMAGSGSSAPPQAAPSTANPGGLTGDRMAASNQEMDMRRAANAQAASEAAARHEPYVASPVLMADDVKRDQDSGSWGLGAGAPVKGPAAASTPAASQAQQQSLQQAPMAAPRQVDVAKVANDMMADKNGDISSQLNIVLGVANPDGTGRSRKLTTGYYPLPTTKTEATAGAPTGALQQAGTIVAAGGTGAASAQPAAAASAQPVVPGWEAGNGFYCKVRYGLNSDLARKDVLAKCYGGPADGAVFIGTAEPSAEGVANPAFTLIFKKVQIPGKGNFAVNAVGIDNETMELATKDEVNDHSFVKFSLIGISGLLKGIGQAAAVVTGTSNTQTIGNVSTTTVNVQRPSVLQQAEIAAGGVGTSIADYAAKKAEALKTTIKLYPGKEIGVVLLDSVSYQKN
ncbi:hypothetical protein [Ralstonia sp. ASV6]|uniref:hypothetical protein n=1 Tax=Ralstonia sp. ASV6 TaxID=2795124 RepID=UPI0018ED390F|nr:hypothetical protein [Ralstonia sp. ASV6]